MLITTNPTIGLVDPRFINSYYVDSDSQASVQAFLAREAELGSTHVIVAVYHKRAEVCRLVRALGLAKDAGYWAALLLPAFTVEVSRGETRRVTAIDCRLASLQFRLHF